MVKAISCLALGAALSWLVLLWDCWSGCQLTSIDLLWRWSSGVAGCLVVGAWLKFRKGP